MKNELDDFSFRLPGRRISQSCVNHHFRRIILHICNKVSFNETVFAKYFRQKADQALNKTRRSVQVKQVGDFEHNPFQIVVVSFDQ
jgi:hypothetical protein